MTIDPTLMSSLMMILVAFGGAFLAALWLACMVWTWRDIRSRTRDPMYIALAVLVVLVLNLPGVLIFLILRPALTLEDGYQRNLEEEALLASIEDQLLCPGCERRVHDDWQLCPNCHTVLRKECQHCKKLLELPWKVCPYCATPVAGMKIEIAVDEQVEPLESENQAE